MFRKRRRKSITALKRVMLLVLSGNDTNTTSFFSDVLKFTLQSKVKEATKMNVSFLCDKIDYKIILRWR